jgi:glycosyltransferase involved in cell wall biosynthesis
MKFAMFTPGLESSAIGRVSALVTQQLLALGHSVVVVRSEHGELLRRATHDFGTRVVAWKDTALVNEVLRDSDVVVYQVGDHYPYHEGCLEWMPRNPGVVCLHDFFVGNLFYGWAESRRSDADNVLRILYGEATGDSYFGFASTDFIGGTRDTAPMTEWVASLACAVVTHSSWGLERVLAACPGPVRVVPLAYVSPPPAPARPAPDPAEFRVLTVGHVNSNKRAESVIRAIGDSPKLRGCTTYRLVGAVQPGTAVRLADFAQSLGVRLVISGESPPDELAAALAEADVVCCLRWPTVEAASASTIEAMLCAKPVVVEDTGFYAELPDDCVAKVQPEREIAELQDTLERLWADSRMRQEMGERASRWAAETFTATNYAEQLVEIAADCRRALPVMEVVEGAVQQLKLWGDVSHLVDLAETIEPLRLFNAATESSR